MSNYRGNDVNIYKVHFFQIQHQGEHTWNPKLSYTSTKNKISVLFNESFLDVSVMMSDDI